MPYNAMPYNTIMFIIMRCISCALSTPQRNLNLLVYYYHKLALTVLVVTIDALREGMGDVGSARYEPALLPPCPTIRVLTYMYSNQ